VICHRGTEAQRHGEFCKEFGFQKNNYLDRISKIDRLQREFTCAHNSFVISLCLSASVADI
jgi:hypothetical protein